MINNPIDLDKFLCEIRERYTPQNIAPNPFFYLVKPTQENLGKYRLNGKNTKSRLTLDLILFPPLVFGLFVKSLLIAVLKKRESSSFNVENLVKSKILIISHFTHAQRVERKDIFFGSQRIFEENHIFYLNSTRLDGREVNQQYAKVGKLNQTINTKSLGFFQTIRLHFTQNRLMFNLISLALGKSEFTIGQKRLLIKAAKWQHHRSTIANLVLRNRILAVLERIQPENIVLTIEGHSHESMIFEIRNSKFKNTKIIGVQHAPIVPGQFSFFRLIGSFSKLDVLLTSGVTPKELVLNKVPSVRVEILGSPKSIEHKPVINTSSKELILGAVEGTSGSLREFINLFNDLATQLPQICFVLRLHPAIDVREANREIKKLLQLKNLSVSKGSLSEDLSQSRIVIYRSSAVGIEALAYSAIPIHFDSSGQNLLNPISELMHLPTGFSNSLEIVRHIKEILRDEKLQEMVNYDFFKVFCGYYSPLEDINLLID